MGHAQGGFAIGWTELPKARKQMAQMRFKIGMGAEIQFMGFASNQSFYRRVACPEVGAA